MFPLQVARRVLLLPLCLCLGTYKSGDKHQPSRGLGTCTLHRQLLRGLVWGFGPTIHMTSNWNNCLKSHFPPPLRFKDCGSVVNPGWFHKAHKALIPVSRGSPENVYTAQDRGFRTFIGNLSCCYFNHATAAQKRKRVRRSLREFCQ